MGSYSNRNPLISEANDGPSASPFAWFYPGNYFAVPKTAGILPSQATQAKPAQGISAHPIRSVAPTKESGKQKSSAKVPNQTQSEALKPKQRKKNTSPKKGKARAKAKAKAPAQGIPEAKREKKNPDINIDISSFDFSGVPSPVCSCTGVPRVCYKWGNGGWQSSCCTINISEYPLPLSTTRPGARLAGRKMSNGAYVKLLLRLVGEGQDLSQPVDLKNHWARHGTNKFVTIK